MLQWKADGCYFKQYSTNYNYTTPINAQKPKQKKANIKEICDK